jgi:hypothetical protein
MVADLAVDAGPNRGSHPESFVRLGSRVVFFARGQALGASLPWATDGTPAGTERLLSPERRRSRRTMGQRRHHGRHAAADRLLPRRPFPALWTSAAAVAGEARLADRDPGLRPTGRLRAVGTGAGRAGIRSATSPPAERPPARTPSAPSRSATGAVHRYPKPAGEFSSLIDSASSEYPSR